jgi:hypothetical protein
VEFSIDIEAFNKMKTYDVLRMPEGCVSQGIIPKNPAT